MTKYIPKATMLLPSDIAFVLDSSKPVLSNARSMIAESGMVPHSHPRGQLLWAVEGVLRVTSEQNVWVVPSTHSVWIPGGVSHQVSCEIAARTCNLYIDPSFPIRQNEKQGAMLSMTPLMREIVLRLTQSPPLMQQASLQRLGLVAIDELDNLQAVEAKLPSGNDPRLVKLISYMVQHPNETPSLKTLSNMAGASVRTVERLFKAETGMTFRQWRSRFRLMNSLELLNKGESSTFVAYSLGYKSVSSFVKAFRQEFGRTPKSFIGSNVTLNTSPDTREKSI
ncbi:AraC family transcriptional regulator [Vibrio sp. MACH09]|uniref:AraC family transcriptional regulator n=1 Tax=unclassified Vibrio TaxID=2614977 RepID=UPI0014937A1C|nr:MULTISPECIES: helix-turn-helix transcriptional regulator [unclassified Vibrio]NOI65032.1 helix-turn-helix transcriptional regulator [Vibrio sp. 99-8-1]GLO62558.1 AraC family transcriptional regulator [Vibrio sp. MACH09]